MKRKSSLLDPALLRAAILPSLGKLDPREQWKNLIMFTGSPRCIIFAFISPTFDENSGMPESLKKSSATNPESAIG